MNPQPNPIVGEAFAFLFLIVVSFYARKAYVEGKGIDFNKLDNFVIGYVEDSPTTQVVEKHFHTTNNPVKIIKEKTETVRVEKVIETQTSFESQQLYSDCIETLVALGVKRGEAKRKAKFVFSTTNPQPKTVQDFLAIAFGMP